LNRSAEETEDQMAVSLLLVEHGLLVEAAGTATQATVTSVTPGAHSFVARSFDGTWESGDSNVVVTLPVPNPPGNFKILSVVLASVGALAVILLMLFRRK
jgi:hypothetical protein